MDQDLREEIAEFKQINDTIDLSTLSIAENNPGELFQELIYKYGQMAELLSTSWESVDIPNIRKILDSIQEIIVRNHGVFTEFLFTSQVSSLIIFLLHYCPHLDIIHSTLDLFYAVLIEQPSLVAEFIDHQPFDILFSFFFLKNCLDSYALRAVQIVGCLLRHSLELASPFYDPPFYNGLTVFYFVFKFGIEKKND
jgi:hypothetical protein